MGIKTINARLKKIVLARLREPGYIKTEIDGLYCYRTDISKTAERCFYRPKIILVLQGRKLAKIGKNEYVYGENQCLISGVDTPGISYVAEGSRSKPLLTMSLDIDLKVISQLVAEMSLKGVDCRGSYRGIAVSNADEWLMEAFLRLAKLLDEDANARAVLSPIIMREIYSRLIISGLGLHIRELCTSGTHSNNIARAVEWIKLNFSKQLDVEDLAKSVNMAPSTFHRHFRKVMSESPLQYQKNLRLLEAKRIMSVENETVSTAAYAVGYESPTQFSREYKRLFGVSPKRDVSI